MLEGWFFWLLFFWCVFMLLFMAVGGYFMFRKFLKQLPKSDGKIEKD